MGWRVAGAMVVAAFLAGCAGNQPLPGLNDFALVPPDPAVQANADPSLHLSELRPGLSKAELETIFPNRMVSGRRFGHNQYYYVEPLGLTTGTKVARDRLELFVNDGKLAAYGVTHSDDEVMGATELGQLPITPEAAPVTPAAPKAAPPRTAAAAPPGGKYAVQIGARRSEAEARALIDEMRAGFPILLGQQWAEIHRVELPQGVMYRVMVGPLATSQQALQLCDGLKAQGTECFLRGT
jgi:hypothetical protein